MTNSQPFSITLSPAQVDQIVRAAAEGSAPGFSTLISTTLLARARLAENGDGVASPASNPSRDAIERLASNAATGASREDATAASNGYFPDHDGDARLSRSLLRGLSILTCFRPGREERGILELASELGMSPSTTHRYVATLVELGLLERCPRSRKYRLASV
jgi:hypothetical protein